MSRGDDAGRDADKTDWDAVKHAALSGEIALDDNRVAALPAAQREELERLLAVRTALQQEADLSAVMLAEVELRLPRHVPLEVESFLRERTAADRRRGAPSVRRNRLLRWGLAAIAAGVLVLTWVAVSPWKPAPAWQGTLSGTTAAVPVSPVDGADDLQTFRWRGELPDRSHDFIVHVFAWDADAPDHRGDQLDTSPRLKVHEWRSRVALPRHICWRVDIVPDEGSPTPGKLVDAHKR